MITCIGDGITLDEFEAAGASPDDGALLISLLRPCKVPRTCIAGLGLVAVVGGVFRLRGRVCGCGGMIAADAVKDTGSASSLARLFGLSMGSKSRARLCASGDLLFGFVEVWDLRGLTVV